MLIILIILMGAAGETITTLIQQNSSGSHFNWQAQKCFNIALLLEFLLPWSILKLELNESEEKARGDKINVEMTSWWKRVITIALCKDIHGERMKTGYFFRELKYSGKWSPNTYSIIIWKKRQKMSFDNLSTIWPT